MSSEYFEDSAIQQLALAKSLDRVQAAMESGIQALNILARDDCLAGQRAKRLPGTAQGLDDRADLLSDRILRAADEMTRKGLSRDAPQ